MFLPKNGDLMQTKAVKLLRFLTQLFTMQSQGCLLLWAQEKFRCKRWTTVGVSQKKKTSTIEVASHRAGSTTGIWCWCSRCTSNLRCSTINLSNFHTWKLEDGAAQLWMLRLKVSHSPAVGNFASTLEPMPCPTCWNPTQQTDMKKIERDRTVGQRFSAESNLHHRFKLVHWNERSANDSSIQNSNATNC